MKRTILFWILAVVITLVSAIYQRVTGPSYPISGKVDLMVKKFRTNWNGVRNQLMII